MVRVRGCRLSLFNLQCILESWSKHRGWSKSIPMPQALSSRNDQDQKVARECLLSVRHGTCEAYPWLAIKVARSPKLLSMSRRTASIPLLMMQEYTSRTTPWPFRTPGVSEKVDRGKQGQAEGLREETKMSHIPRTCACFLHLDHACF